MKTVKDILGNRTVITVQEGDSVKYAAQVMAEYKIGGLPVLKENRLAGIFTERDMITRVVALCKDPASTKVGEVMSHQLIAAHATDTYESCLKKMKNAMVRHLPVIEGEHLVGIISIRDLILVDMNAKDEKIDFLEQYIFTVPPGLEKKYET
jgi:CBS domain-containing protein